MSLFSTALSWLGFGGPQRLAGQQSATPTTYATDAAKPVTFDTAMQVSAFWACARLISETVACLPLVLYRLENGTRTVDESHWLHGLLAYKPNRYQTKIEFFETLVLNLCTWGNAYALIERNGQGHITSLLPIMSAQVTTELLSDGSVVHLYRSEGGVRALAPENVWHIKLFGNGIVGLSPMGYARNSIGIAQAAEDRVTAVFRNGAKPTGVLMVDAALNKAQRAEIRGSFSDLAEGNSDSLIVLDKFMKYQQVSMSPQDIELLQSRRFQLEDIARFMGVPSVLINDTSATTVWGSGIQQLIEGAYKLNFRPYLERIELSARVHLLPVADRRRYELELDFDSLLRMDEKSRIETNARAIQTGQKTPNEARATEGRPPQQGGDVLRIQGATVPIDQAGKQQPVPATVPNQPEE